MAVALTYQTSIHEEIKSGLNWGNACYRQVQNILSFHLLSKNVKIKKYRIITLPLFYMGVETGLSRIYAEGIWV